MAIEGDASVAVISLLVYLVALAGMTVLGYVVLFFDTPYARKVCQIATGVYIFLVVSPWLAYPLPHLDKVLAVSSGAMLLLYLLREPSPGEIGYDPNDPDNRA